MKVRKKVRVGFILTSIIVLLIGCLPNKSDTTQDSEIDILPADKTPSVYVEENYYAGLLPFVTSQARGTIDTYLSNYRLDADRMELGLQEIAQDFFPTDKHLFREGQLINKEEIVSWLKIQSSENNLGLNPEGKNERIVMHILEHNYWDERANSLEGIVIGLSLAPKYTIEEDINDNNQTRQLYYTDDELRNFGQTMANEMTQRIRNIIRTKLGETQSREIPIVFALYRLEEQNSLVPGNFLSVGLAPKNELQVSSWKTINEIYFLFPSNPLDAFERDRSLTNASKFDEFKREVESYFPNFIGLVGIGRYINEQLVELTITATTEFGAKTEVIQLTQFLAGQSIELFPKNVHINIYVQTINKPQAVFIRPTEGDPYMHIYRN